MFSNINMRKVTLWLCVVMIVSFLIAGIILYTKGFNTTIFGNNNNATEQNINVEKSFNSAIVSDIEISAISPDIRLIPVDTNDIKAHLYGATSSGTKLVAIQNGSTLNVTIKLNPNRLHNINFQSNELKLDVYIPKSYSKNIMVTSISGALTVKNLNLDNFSFYSTSGDLNSTSTTANKAMIKTTSGKMNLKSFKGDLDFNSVSGNINVDYAIFKNNIKTYSVSGSTKINIPKDSQFNINFSSVTGAFISNLPNLSKGIHNSEISVGNSDNTITLKSVSGDVDVEIN